MMSKDHLQQADDFDTENTIVFIIVYAEERRLGMRLDKFLSTYAGLSRKEAKEAVKRGRVTVDGRVAKRAEEKVETPREGDSAAGSAGVFLDGRRIVAEEYVYYMLNKPAGVVSATRDSSCRTVTDLIDHGKREIFPVGRLDKDTEGLLLLTDDGELAHRLLSPKFHVDKSYLVRYEGELQEEAVELFRQGLDIGEKKITRPAVLELLGSGEAKVTISEGKYHQVKRMFGAVGAHVTALKRISMGSLLLDESLRVGEYRKLTEKEVDELWQRKNIM